LGLKITRQQLPQKHLVVRNGSYLLETLNILIEQEEILIDLLTDYIGRNENKIDCVVELGSGFGRNLFALSAKLDSGIKKKVHFFSCEFTDSGKNACKELLKLGSDIRMSVEHFDYYHPDFTFIPQGKNTLFFTSHSIEQIPVLNKKVFTAMIQRAADCHCYHAEPVGWQYDENLREERKNKALNNYRRKQSSLKRKLYKFDRRIFNKYYLSFMDSSRRIGINIEKSDIGKSSKVSANAAKWSMARDYNTNLVPLIKEMDNENLIKIELENINLYGKNPFNPTTIISWHKAAY
jgi:hypothetical protein